MTPTGTKITLSHKELELVCNTEWILTKHTIIQKVYQLFGEVLPALENMVHAHKEQLPAEMFFKAAKISRGESYRQLPYVMLDYPRHFGKEGTVAIRSFFWWGNFFSTSLQLSGDFQQRAIPLLEKKFNWLQQQQYWLCVNEAPWEHHFEKDNFRLLQTMDREEFVNMLSGKPFVKIAKKMSLQQWQDVPEFIKTNMEELTGLLTGN